MESERLRERNAILDMNLDQLEYHIKNFSPELYEEAVSLSKCGSRNMILKHGDRIRDEDMALNCLQSMVLYYRGLYKKDCRVWMYKSVMKSQSAQGMNTSNNNDSLQYELKQSDGPVINSAFRERSVLNNPLGERNVFAASDYHQSHRSSLNHLCVNQQPQFKPISAPELTCYNSASQESDTTLLGSNSRRLASRAARNCKLRSRSDTFLLRYRPYIEFSKSSLSLSRLPDSSKSCQYVDENDTRNLRMAAMSGANTAIFSEHGRHMTSFHEEGNIINRIGRH